MYETESLKIRNLKEHVQNFKETLARLDGRKTIFQEDLQKFINKFYDSISNFNLSDSQNVDLTIFQDFLKQF